MKYFWLGEGLLALLVIPLEETNKAKKPRIRFAYTGLLFPVTYESELS
jgi:hypothetical protein